MMSLVIERRYPLGDLLMSAPYWSATLDVANYSILFLIFILFYISFLTSFETMLDTKVKDKFSYSFYLPKQHSRASDPLNQMQMEEFVLLQILIFIFKQEFFLWYNIRYISNIYIISQVPFPKGIPCRTIGEKYCFI